MAKQSDDKWRTPSLPQAASGDDVSADTALTALELSQIYTLIDSILPFEACLYYQVLPLYIEGSRLVMGMVNPEDPAASEYVTKQLSYINYSLRFQAVSSDWHRELLSKYLKHTAQAQPTTAPRSPTAKPSAEAEPAERPDTAAIAPSDAQEASPPTYVVDQPDELSDQGFGRPTPSPLQSDETLPVEAIAPSAETPATRTTSAATSPPRSPTAAPPSPDPLELQVDSYYRDISNALLSSLPPPTLMQALLGKVLDEGIGRLYFERSADSGRVLWSRDGVLQAVVDTITPEVFQGVINEFKRLMHLSLIAIRQTKQTEIERTYQGQRILLRLQLMRGDHGEEATVQILRGAALRFYQQQQIERLGRDALDAAQTLQQRINEIRDRARNSLNFQPTRSEILPTLVKLLAELEAQVKEIEAAYDAKQ